jgi:hypothetical protein
MKWKPKNKAMKSKDILLKREQNCLAWDQLLAPQEDAGFIDERELKRRLEKRQRGGENKRMKTAVNQ